MVKIKKIKKVFIYPKKKNKPKINIYFKRIKLSNKKKSNDKEMHNLNSKNSFINNFRNELNSKNENKIINIFVDDINKYK